MPADEMPLALCAKAILRQIRLARQQTKRRGRHSRRPAAHFEAKRAVAAHRAVRQIQIGCEANGPAVTASVIGFHLSASLYVGGFGTPSAGVISSSQPGGDDQSLAGLYRRDDKIRRQEAAA